MAGVPGRAGVPNLWAAERYRSGPVRNQAAQQEVNLNVMCLNHPQTIPVSPVCGKIVFHETSPCAKKVGDRCAGGPP